MLEALGMGETKALDLQRTKQAERQARDLCVRTQTQLIDKHVRFSAAMAQPSVERVLLRRRPLRAFAERELQPTYRGLQEAGVGWHEFGAALFYERIIAGDRSELANS